MYYIIQEDFFIEERYQVIFHALDRLGLEYETVKILPFVDTIEYKTDRKDVFCFGSVKLANIARKEGWIPGSLFGGDHDFLVYRGRYGDNLLNYNCRIQTVGQPLNFTYERVLGNSQTMNQHPLFIRPTVDSKIFNGGVYTRTKWEEIITRLAGKYDDHAIQVTRPRRIYKEARVWIVGGKVITSSYYKFHTYDSAFEEFVSPEGLEFAQKMADIWQPADAYCMDVCSTPDGWKIVELNCINCSGFYKGDMQKVLIALEEFYS